MKMLMFGTMAALADSQNMNGTCVAIREHQFRLTPYLSMFHFRTSSIVENGKAVNAERGLRFTILGHPRLSTS
jgi:hypothetical protein